MPFVWLSSPKLIPRCSDWFWGKATGSYTFHFCTNYRRVLPWCIFSQLTSSFLKSRRDKTELGRRLHQDSACHAIVAPNPTEKGKIRNHKLIIPTMSCLETGGSFEALASHPNRTSKLQGYERPCLKTLKMNSSRGNHLIGLGPRHTRMHTCIHLYIPCMPIIYASNNTQEVRQFFSVSMEEQEFYVSVDLHSNSRFRIRATLSMKCGYAVSTNFVKVIDLFSTFLAPC